MQTEATYVTFDQFEKCVLSDIDELDASPTQRMGGILFMRRGEKVAEGEIIPSLYYFDQRSKDDIDFYLPGWTAMAQDGANASMTPNWVFDTERFIAACNLFEAETDWSYSGGVDLLLFGMKRTSAGGYAIDLRRVVAIPLLEMREQKQIESIGVLFERIFAFARNNNITDPLSAFALQETRVSLIEGIIQGLIGFFARDAKENLSYARNLQLRDVTKPGQRNLAIGRHTNETWYSS